MIVADNEKGDTLARYHRLRDAQQQEGEQTMQPIIVSNLPEAIIVFTLLGSDMHPLMELRYGSDPRCDVEVGDTWTRVTDDGGVSRHRVWEFSKRQNNEGVTEEHAILIPVAFFEYH